MRTPVAAVVTCSTRAAAGDYADTTGPMIAEALAAWGCEVMPIEVVADGAPVAAALRRVLAAGADVVVTSGGTGLSPTDETPERTREVLLYEVPGIAEELRAVGVRAGVPAAMLSRGVAGAAHSAAPSGRSLVVNLPGSAGGVRDGLGVVSQVWRHVLDQLGGGDHERRELP